MRARFTVEEEYLGCATDLENKMMAPFFNLCYVYVNNFPILERISIWMALFSISAMSMLIKCNLLIPIVFPCKKFFKNKKKKL